MQIPFKRMEGEAAFYGPKIDVKLIDAIGRPWQLTTVQFDFNLPKRFGLEYVGEDGSRHQPLMVHRALWGSVERFFGILIEHYAGAFPLWLAPVQVAVLPVSNKFTDYAKAVAAELSAAGIRATLDDRNEKLQAKIRDSEMQKIPYMTVVGGKEAEARTVSVRHHGQGDVGAQPLAEFVAETARRSRRAHDLLGFSYFSDIFLRARRAGLAVRAMLESRNAEERKRADWAFHNHCVLSAKRESCLRRRSAN